MFYKDLNHLYNLYETTSRTGVVYFPYVTHMSDIDSTSGLDTIGRHSFPHKKFLYAAKSMGCS